MMRRQLMAGAAWGFLAAALAGCSPNVRQRAEQSAQRLSAWLATAPQVATVDQVTTRTNDLARPWADATVTLAASVDQAGLAALIESFYTAVGSDYWSVRPTGKVTFSIDSEPRANPGLPSVWHQLTTDPLVVSGRVIHQTERVEFDVTTSSDSFAHLLDLLGTDWMNNLVGRCFLRGADQSRTCSYRQGTISPPSITALGELADHYQGPLAAELTGTQSGTITINPASAEAASLREWLAAWTAPGTIEVIVR